ncbi:MAG: transposase [Deltaproteobacteria bacterium]|jgi:putative transposase|nr:transposase [Deltaproteobacteria bacterium]
METIIRKGFKFKLNDPTGAAIRLIKRFAGCRRFVFNAALARQKERLDAHAPLFSYYELANWLVSDLKADPQYAFLKQASAQSLQQGLMDLSQAIIMFKKGQINFPKFQKKGMGDSFRYPQRFHIDEPNSRVYLPKIGWIKYHKSREIVGKPKNVTVSIEADGFYVSIQTETCVDILEANPINIIGLDMGVKNFLTMSDGTMVKPLALNKEAKKLKKLQRIVSRKLEAAKKNRNKLQNGPKNQKNKQSKRLEQAKRKVARQHKRIRDKRQDFLQKMSTTIAKNQSVVVVEDLRVKNMSKSARGTVEKPGKNVAAKKGLNRSILAQGWGIFLTFLDYKLAQNGGELIRVPPQYTSQKCPICGYTHKDNRKTQAKFKCLACGYENNADIVGAINVLAAGLAVVKARGGYGALGQPIKREPTEGSVWSSSPGEPVGIPGL